MITGPPYDPFIPEIIPIFYLYLILFPISMILGFILIHKGISTKSNSARLLGFAFIFFGTSIFVVFIGLLEVIITSEFREIYRFSLPAAYSLGIIGNFLVLMFGFTLFGYQKKIFYIFLFWNIINLVLINLDSNWYGVPNYYYEGQFSIRFISSILMTIYAMSIYLYIISKIHALKIEKLIIKFGYNLIILSFLFFLSFWICMTLDVVYIAINGRGYSFFVIIAWVFAMLFWIFSYIGLIMPPRFRRIIDHYLSKKSK